MSYSFILADSMKGDYAFPLPILFLCLPADYRIMTRSIVVIFFFFFTSYEVTFFFFGLHGGWLMKLHCLCY